MRALSSAVAALALAGAPAAAAADGVEVRWEGKAYAPDELPEALGPAPRAAVAAWADVAAKEGWRMDLDEEGRLLLVSANASHASKHLRLVEKTAKLFEQVLPMPPEAREPAEPAAPDAPELPEDPDVIPEDPEGPPPVEPVPGPEGEEPWSTSWTWGTGERVLDQETVVLFVLQDESQVRPVLEELRGTHEYLASWIPKARDLAGWVLEQPLCGVCYEWPSGVEEWRVDNEIVHRTAELLCLRRFGPLPYWLVQGWAWEAELRLERSVYCFPYRSEFVWATEHTGWDGDLKRILRARGEQGVDVADLTRLQRRSYDGDSARLARGLVKYLAEEHPEGLPRLLEALRVYRDRENRVDQGDGTWTRNPEFDVPDEAQREVLREVFDGDVLAEFSG